MADQQNPVLAAAGQGAPAPEQAPAPPPPMAMVDEQMVCETLLRAIKTCAEKGPGAGDARETSEYASAAYAFAQAYVQIHPGLMAPQGVTPEQVAASIPQQVEGGAETAAEGGQETATDAAGEGNG